MMIDILLATYNGEEYLDDLLCSIERQTDERWRLIACDDGSTDSTIDILQERVSRDPERYVLVEDVPSGSAKSNFLRLLRHSSAEGAMFCDQDDVWKTNKIEVFVERYERCCDQSSPCLLFSDLEVVDEGLRPVADSFMSYSKLNPRRTSTNRLLALNCIAGCSSMMNRELVSLINRTPHYSDIVMHDAWVALVASLFGEIAYIDETLVLYRQHGTNDTGAKAYSAEIRKGLSDAASRRARMRGTIDQARYLLDIYGDDCSIVQREMLEGYARLNSETSKLMRIAECFRHKYWKYGFARKMDQLLFV